jgi:starch synthase
LRAEVDIRSYAPENLAESIAAGFAFDDDTPQALISAIERAITLFLERENWQRMMPRAMTRDFSWETAAREYIDVLTRAPPGLST